MTYDFYAEMWDQQELERRFAEFFNKKWDEIRKNSLKKDSKIVKGFRKALENDTGLYEEIVRDHLKGNTAICATLYQKFLLILEREG